MTENARESRLSAAFVRLADTLVADYDVIDLLHTLVDDCVDLLDVQVGGLLLADGHGRLELAASTSEKAEFVEVLQLNAGAGPCVQCFNTGKQVSLPNVEAARPEWEEFCAAALMQGFHSVLAVPLRLRAEVIGAMNLFRTTVGELESADIKVAQALADVATIGILHERIARESSIVNEQLTRALDSRILIEQAKGMLAESGNMGVDDAFRLLRAHARSNNVTLRSVAESVVGRTMNILPTRHPDSAVDR